MVDHFAVAYLKFTSVNALMTVALAHVAVRV